MEHRHFVPVRTHDPLQSPVEVQQDIGQNLRRKERTIVALNMTDIDYVCKGKLNLCLRL